LYIAFNCLDNDSYQSLKWLLHETPTELTWGQQKQTKERNMKKTKRKRPGKRLGSGQTKTDKKSGFWLEHWELVTRNTL
jgi:hypothetical protein